MTDEAAPSPPPHPTHLQTNKSRAFVIPIHPTHGILLLHCTRKRNKGPHYQLPGGHMDDADLLSALEHKKESSSPISSSPQSGGGVDDETLRTALRICAAREMYEETGIDVRDQLERLELARVGARKMGESVTTVRNGTTGVDEANNKVSVFEKNRWYFCLDLNDDDFPKQTELMGIVLQPPLGDEGNHLKLRLSNEHSGYRFETDVEKAVKRVRKHSGGYSSKALCCTFGI